MSTNEKLVSRRVFAAKRMADERARQYELALAGLPRKRPAKSRKAAAQAVQTKHSRGAFNALFKRAMRRLTLSGRSSIESVRMRVVSMVMRVLTAAYSHALAGCPVGAEGSTPDVVIGAEDLYYALKLLEIEVLDNRESTTAPIAADDDQYVTADSSPE